MNLLNVIDYICKSYARCGGCASPCARPIPFSLLAPARRPSPPPSPPSLGLSPPVSELLIKLCRSKDIDMEMVKLLGHTACRNRPDGSLLPGNLGFIHFTVLATYSTA